MTISGAELADLLERRGFDFFAGVPCSLIEDLVAVLESHPCLPYVAAPAVPPESDLSDTAELPTSVLVRRGPVRRPTNTPTDS
jgi:hypothetical protein